jgi:hypothetical protein
MKIEAAFDISSGCCVHLPGFDLDLMTMVALNDGIVADIIIATSQDTTITTTTTTNAINALVADLLQLGILAATNGTQGGKRANEQQTINQLNNILALLKGADLSGLSVVDIASTTSDLIGIVDTFGFDDGAAGADSDAGVLITMVAAQFADALPEGTTIYGSSGNVALVLSNVNVKESYTIDVAAIATDTSGAVIGTGSVKADTNLNAGISMTLPSYSKFDKASNTTEGAEDGDSDGKVVNNGVGIATAVFSNTSSLYKGSNLSSQVLSVKFGTKSKVGAPFDAGEVVQFSLLVHLFYN